MYCFQDCRRHCLSAGATIIRGVGRAISHIFKSGGVYGLVILGYIFLIVLLVVALGIPVMPIVNRDYLKPVLLYVYVKTHSSVLF